MTAFAMELSDASHTEFAGAALARALDARTGAVIFLRGDLGAGKTTLARGLLRAFGISGAVRSPTYTLMEPYLAVGRSVLHMDLYRLADPSELWALGLDDYSPQDTLWLVEWPERGGDLLPQPALTLELAHLGAHRSLRVDGDADLIDRYRAELKTED